VHHKGRPDYDLAAKLVRSLDAPVILTGGLSSPAAVRAAFERTGAAGVMLARGALGNPWLFAQVLGTRAAEPAPDEVLAELHWVMDRAVEHLGPDRAGRYLRKFYPWYVERLGDGKALQEALQRTATVADARAVLNARERLPEAA
jgi:tRNA-dihydrouridine synthase B